MELMLKCACCGRLSKIYSESVKRALGQIICLECEIEREYEIDAMMSARYEI